VFNSEVGCFACRARVRKYEEERFDKLKKLDEFYALLRHVPDLDALLSAGLHEQQQFLAVYEPMFPAPRRARPERDKDALDDEALNAKLVENNARILEVIELDDLRLNVAKEAPCHEFFDTSDAYKLKGKPHRRPE